MNSIESAEIKQIFTYEMLILLKEKLIQWNEKLEVKAILRKVIV